MEVYQPEMIGFSRYFASCFGQKKTSGTETDHCEQVIPFFGKVVNGGVQAVAAGNRRSMILKRGGTLWGTGRNNFGQLGDGLNSEANVFVKIILSDGECARAENIYLYRTYLLMVCVEL